MKQKINASIILALLMAFAFIACNDEKKTEETATTDAAETTTTPTRDPAMDPVKVAPGIYRALADTLDIRISEVTVKPGESVAMHSHPDHSIYVVEGGTVEFEAKDGTKSTTELKTGMGIVVPAETHAGKNTGTATVRLILTEVFRAATALTRDPATDPVKIAPGVYKVFADTMNIRISEVTVKPGETVPMHSHPDHSIYVAQGGTVEFEAKDGTKTTTELKTGMGVVVPAETHAGKNTGTGTVRLILTEVFRN